jgi:anti-sigma regulatory factor (Ser/Thr protein kinase)
MSIKWRLSVWATPGQAREVARKAVAFLGHYIDSSELLYELELALTEACANVVVHAYAQDMVGTLELVLTLEPYESVEFEIGNWGVPFWGVLGQALSGANPDDESGRGLLIMSSLVDHLRFTRQGAKNILWMSKNIEDGLWKRRSSSNGMASARSPIAES